MSLLYISPLTNVYSIGMWYMPHHLK